MKIKKLEANNFAGIESVSAEPNRVNVVIGENGHGKSSFLKAIRYALLGSSTRSKLLKHGKSQGNVVLESDIVNIEKIIEEDKSSVYVNGKKTTQKSLTEFLENEVGASKDAMKLLASSEVFENFTSGEFTEFLLGSGLIPATLDADKFVAIAKKSMAISPEVEDNIRKLLPTPPAVFDLDKIAEIDDFLTSSIKSQKKEVERITAIVSSIVAAEPKRSLADIDKEIQDIAADEAKATAAADILKKRAASAKEIADLTNQLKMLPDVRPNPVVKKKAEDQQTSIQADITKTSGVIAALNSNNKLLEQQLNRLEGSKCPLSDKLVCTQDKTAVKAELSAQIDENNIQIELMQEDLNGYTAALNAVNATLKKWHEDDGIYQKRLLIKNRIEALEKAMPDPLTASSFDPMRKEILLKEKANVEAYLRKQNAQEMLLEQTEKLELLKNTELLTSKKGNVKASILKITLGALVGHINTLAASIAPHLSLQLEVGENGNVSVMCKTRTGLQDYQDLSTGEKLIVQFLIMTEINQLSGFKILILDNLDKLDAGNFKGLLEFLDQPVIEEYYDHVFLSTVNHTDFIEVLDDMKTVKVINL